MPPRQATSTHSRRQWGSHCTPRHVLRQQGKHQPPLLHPRLPLPLPLHPRKVSCRTPLAARHSPLCHGFCTSERAEDPPSCTAVCLTCRAMSARAARCAASRARQAFCSAQALPKQPRQRCLSARSGAGGVLLMSMPSRQHLSSGCALWSLCCSEKKPKTKRAASQLPDGRFCLDCGFLPNLWFSGGWRAFGWSDQGVGGSDQSRLVRRR